jgi:hypothetical protein
MARMYFRCRAHTATGAQCSRSADGGSSYCRQHAADTAAQRHPARPLTLELPRSRWEVVAAALAAAGQPLLAQHVRQALESQP